MEYQKCFVQLEEILNHIREEDLKRIPYEIRKAIREQKDKQYKWNYDKTKSLSQQNIDRKTIAMLSYLNLEYLVSEEQKEVLERMHKLNENKAEEEKEKKYNTKELFKHKRKEQEEHATILAKTKKDKWYQKVVVFFRKIVTREKDEKI